VTEQPEEGDQLPEEGQGGEVPDDTGGDARDSARDSAGKQAESEGDTRDGGEQASGNPGNAG
jgi:hypothetical protein